MARTGFIKRLIFGGGGTFRDYERACLAAVAERVSVEARAILNAQLEAVEIIQRFSDDKLTAIHLAPLDDRDHFHDRRSELRVAKFRLGSPGREPITGTLVVHHGRISSLEFSRSPKGPWKPPIAVSDVDILNDPSLARADATPTEGVAASETIEIAGTRFAAQDIVLPLPLAERACYLNTLGTTTPDDYAELLAVTNGFKLGNWLFLGTAPRMLILPDVTYIIAAERSDSTCALCFTQGSRTPSVLILDEIDLAVRSAEASFLEALTRVTAQSS